MSILTRDGDANGHYLTGYIPESNDLYFDYTAPINDEKWAYIERALESMFPQQDFDIYGALWDYSKSTEAENRDGPNGHYRVNVGGRDFILCINNHMDDEAIRLGADVYTLFQDQGLNVSAPSMIPFSQKWSHSQDGKYIHIENYNGGAKWLSHTKMTDQNNIAAKLGEMVGKVYVASQNVTPELEHDLTAYADETFYHLVRTGIQRVKNPEVFEEAQISLMSVDGGLDVYTGVMSRVEGVIKIVNDGKRILQHGNMIEKMVSVDDKGDFHLAGSDCASYSFFPMMSDNATYDVGTAVYRVLLNPNFYDASIIEKKDQKMMEALSDFVESYNKTTGLNLTSEEALDASLSARDFLGLYEIGQYVASDNTLDKQQEFRDHVENIMKPAADHIAEVVRYRSMLGVAPMFTVNPPAFSLKRQ